MYKILLDEDFYIELNRNKEYFDKLINFLIRYTDFKFIVFHPFGKSKDSYHHASARTIIERELLKSRRLEKHDLTLITAVTDCDFQSLRFSEEFIGKIHYIHATFSDIKLIIPLTVDRHFRNLKVCKDYIYYINHYMKETKSNICQWVQEGVVEVAKPDKNEMFPAKVFCTGYEELRESILKSFTNETKRAEFLEIGFEVAGRNRYTFNERLSTINTKHRGSTRKIFMNDIKTEIYLSIDFENGGFEVFNKNGKHKGQYRFDGEFDKEAKPLDHYIVLN